MTKQASPSPFHITRLEVEHVKRINLVRIDADGKSVILTGDNAQGKSSIIDAVFLALTGKGLDEPIQRGSSKASVNLVIGNAEKTFEVEKSITAKGSYLRVRDAEGKQVPSPQQFIDGLIGGRLALDPLAFLDLAPKAQADSLKEVLGLSEKFAALDAERKGYFEARTISNRQKDTAEKQLQPMKAPAAGLPEEEVTAGGLIAERDALQAKAQVAKEAMQRSLEADDCLEDAEALVKDYEGKLAAAKKALVDAQKAQNMRSDEMDKAAAEAPKPADVEAVTKKLSELDATNAAIRAGREYRRVFGEFKKARDESESLTKNLEKIEESRAKLLKDAKLPVDGMTIGEDGVFVDGLPLSQKSTAEQIRLSAMIAMAAQPQLRLLIVREGALCSVANRKLIYDMAEERQFQVFEERFSETPGAEGLFLVDGEIAFVDGKPV